MIPTSERCENTDCTDRALPLMSACALHAADGITRALVDHTARVAVTHLGHDIDPSFWRPRR